MPHSNGLRRAAAVTMLMAGFALCAPVQSGAAVYSPQQALPATTIQAFVADPSTLLSQYPNGGPQLITQVRDLAASDPQTLSAIIGLLSRANPDQAAAIGTGLGQVALMAVRDDQDYATKIQTDVAAGGNTFALVAYSAVVGGDIKLAATTSGGGAGGGGEAGTGGGTPFFTFGGSSSFNLHTFANNIPDSFVTLTFTPSTPGTPSVSPTTP